MSPEQHEAINAENGVGYGPGGKQTWSEYSAEREALYKANRYRAEKEPPPSPYGAPNHSIPRGGLVAAPATPPPGIPGGKTVAESYKPHDIAQLAKQDREAAQSGAVARETAGLRAHFARKNEAYEAARRRQLARSEGGLLPTKATEIERMREDAATRRARMQEAGANTRAKIQADSAASVAKENAGGLVNAAEWNAKGAENAAKWQARGAATAAAAKGANANGTANGGLTATETTESGPDYKKFYLFGEDGKGFAKHNPVGAVRDRQGCWWAVDNDGKRTAIRQGDWANYEARSRGLAMADRGLAAQFPNNDALRRKYLAEVERGTKYFARLAPGGPVVIMDRDQLHKTSTTKQRLFEQLGFDRNTVPEEITDPTVLADLYNAYDLNVRNAQPAAGGARTSVPVDVTNLSREEFSRLSPGTPLVYPGGKTSVKQ